MKLPLDANQTLAASAIALVLLGGAYAVGRSQAPAAAPAMKDEAAATAEAVPPKAAAKQAHATTSAAPAALCRDCARVTEVRSELREGQASGLGAVGGALVGGLLGHQVGGGTGKKIATVGGAVAGGYAGNEIEKRQKSRRVWIVRLQHEDGSSQTRELAQDPQLRAGDVVELRDGQLRRR